MPNVALYNKEGKEVGKVELSEKVFGAEVNVFIMHQVVVNYLAGQRQGTQSALTRAEVSGGGIKPWRQKGTGRARQGSIRSPQWTGGGVVFAPKPRDYSFSVNRKVRMSAMRSALSDKVANDKFVVIDAFDLENGKTKEMVAILNNLNVTTKTLVVSADKDEVIFRSARNIEGVKATFVGEVNVYDVINADKVVILKSAVDKLEEVYA